MELIDKVFNPDSLTDAYYEARKYIRFKKVVQQYGINLFRNVHKTCRDYISGKFKFQKLYEFTLTERGKRRDIKASSFYDRVPIHALCKNLLNPVLRRYLIYDNCASLEGRGIGMQRDRIKVHLQKYYRHYGNKGYVLKGDFKNFFGSFDHDKVTEFLQDKFEPETVEFVKTWMKQYGSVGVGIGGEPSQILGVAFPSRIDNYVKIVRGCKYYGRYQDDFYIFHPDKTFLESVLDGIRKEANELNLTINDKKTYISKISEPFTFLKIKYHLTNSGRIIMKHSSDTFIRESRKLKKYKTKIDNGEMTYDQVKTQFKSWYGNMKKYNNYESMKRIKKLYYDIYKEAI